MSTLNTWQDLHLWQLPTPRIRKVAVGNTSSDGNLRFDLDIDIEGPFVYNNKSASRGNDSFSAWVKNSNLKIAVIYLEAGNDDPNLVENIIRDFQSSSFLPIASDLILQADPSAKYARMKSKGNHPSIRILSLQELAAAGSLTIQDNHPSPQIWTAQVRGLKFASNKRVLKHASFCVMPFVNITDITSGGKKRYSKSTIGLLKGGSGLFRKYVANHMNQNNPEDCLLYNYYAYDYAVAIENGNVQRGGFLLKRGDNGSIYTGPWHTNNGIPMIGKYRGDKRLKAQERNVKLEKINIPCGRIQDHRSTNRSSTKDWSGWEEEAGLRSLVASIQASLGIKKNSFVLKTDPPKAFIKDFTAIDKQYNFNTLFTLDMPNLVLANTSLAAAMKNTISSNTNDSRRALKAIMSLCTIQHCEIHRREVRTDRPNDGKLTAGSMIEPSMRPSIMSDDMLALTSDAAQTPKNILIFSDTNRGIFQEIENFTFQKDDMNNFMRTFSFREKISEQDSQNTKYQYKIFLSVKDGVVTYASNLIRDLVAKYALYTKEVAPILEMNRGSDKFSIKNIKSRNGKSFIKNFNSKALLPLLDSLSKSIRFFAGKPMRHNEIETSLFMRANFLTGDVSGVQLLKDLVEELVGSFSKMTDLNLTAKNALSIRFDEGNTLILEQIPESAGTDVGLRSKISNRSQVSSLKNIITHSENFESILDNTGSGCEYMFGNLNGSKAIATMRASDFNRRYQRELNKYFEAAALKEAMANGNTNIPIEENQTRFFTPISFKLGKRFYNIPRVLNINTLTATYQIVLDILYFKEGTGLTESQSELNLLATTMTSIVIESSDRVPPRGTSLASPQSRELVVNTGKWETTVDALAANGESWKLLQQSQGGEIDRIVEQEDYTGALTQNRGRYETTILDSIVSNRVFNKKVALRSVFSRTTDFVKQKTYSKDTSPQMISALLRFSPQQMSSSPSVVGSKTNLLNKALRKGDLNPGSLNPRSLSAGGAYWWLNYDNMIEVQFCVSMDMLNGTQWLPLTNGAFNAAAENGSALFCRLVRKIDPSLNQIKNKHLELSIFNEYFVIQSPNPSKSITIGAATDTRSPAQKTIYRVAELADKYSDDFYKFVQSDTGRVNEKSAAVYRTSYTKGAINAILEKDPSRMTVQRKLRAKRTPDNVIKASTPIPGNSRGY